MGKAAFAQYQAFRAATWIAVLVLVLCLCSGPALAAAEGSTSILKPPPAARQRRALIASVSRKQAQLGQQVFGARSCSGSSTPQSQPVRP